MYRIQSSTRGAIAFAAAILACAGVSACAAGMQTGASAEAEAHANMTAVHVAEIEEAQLALSKTQNAQVRAFAQHLVTDHRALLQEEQQLARQMGLQVAAGAMIQTAGIGAEVGLSAETEALVMSIPSSRALVQQHLGVMADLSDESGAQFDRHFMERQIYAHRQALEVAARFEAGVQNPQQRALIARERAGVDAHLLQAEQIRAGL